MKKTQKGFTLVEVIIVLVIIAILSVMLVPSLTGYIDNAKRSQVLAECKMATAAAQTLYGDYFASVNEITYDEIEDLAEVPGEVTLVARNEAVDKHVVVHLTYQNNGLTCTYCKYYSSCSEHDMLFSFTDGIGGEPGADEGDGNTNPGGNVGGNENIIDIYTPDGTDQYRTIGDIIVAVDTEKENGGWGLGASRNDIFYWNGSHYIVSDGSIYLKIDEAQSWLVTLLGEHKIHKINPTVKPSPSLETTIAGDVAGFDNGNGTTIYRIFNPFPLGVNSDLTAIDSWNYENSWVDINNKIN